MKPASAPLWAANTRCLSQILALLLLAVLSGCALLGDGPDVELRITELDVFPDGDAEIGFVGLGVENRGWDPAPNVRYRIRMTPLSGEETEPVGQIPPSDQTFTLYRGVLTVPRRSSEYLELFADELAEFAEFALLDYPAGNYQVTAELDYNDQFTAADAQTPSLGLQEPLQLTRPGGISAAPPGVIRVIVDEFVAPGRTLDSANPLRVWIVPAENLLDPQPGLYATELVVTGLGFAEVAEEQLRVQSPSGNYHVAAAHDDGTLGDLDDYFRMDEVPRAVWYSSRGREPENILIASLFAGSLIAADYVEAVSPGTAVRLGYNLETVAFVASPPRALAFRPDAAPANAVVLVPASEIPDAPEVDIDAANAGAQAPGLPLLEPETGYGGSTSSSGLPRAYRLNTPPGTEVFLVVDDGYSGTGQYSYDIVGDLWRESADGWQELLPGPGDDFDDITPYAPLIFTSGVGPAVVEIQPIGPDSNALYGPASLPEFAGNVGTYGIGFQPLPSGFSDKGYPVNTATGSGSELDPRRGDEEGELTIPTVVDPAYFRSVDPPAGARFVRLWILDESVAPASGNVVVSAEWEYTTNNGATWNPLSDVGGVAADADGDGIVLGTSAQPVVASFPAAAVGQGGFRLVFRGPGGGPLETGGLFVIAYDFYQ